MTMAKPRAGRRRQPPGRRQLVAALVLAVGAYLPLARFLDWRINTFVALLLILRMAGLRWPRANPGRLMLVVLTLAGAANVFATHHSLVGQRGGTALFATMLALKLLELRERRDLQVVAVVLGFLVVVQFLFDQSMALAAYLGVITLGVVAILVDLNGGLGAGGWRSASGIALRLCLQAVPLTLILFLLFPRLSAPLWRLGLEPSVGVMGMSDRLELGSISELVANGELAFRARFEQEPPGRDRLYWRGLILWTPDERGWSPGLDPKWTVDTTIEEAGESVSYEVLLEPTQQRWLFGLDLPVEVPAGALRSADFQFLAKEPITAVKRYRVRSVLDYRTAQPPDWLRKRALEPPPNVTERMRRLVAGWRLGTDDPRALVQKALGFFNRESFHYTLLPPKLGANPIDEFLFETRRGFCEHFASSFAVLMRVAGIPSRVVLGYLGGEPNRIGGYYMVWQSDAHAWVEVLIPERGWVRVDPTAAIDPSRVDYRSASQLLGSNAPLRFDLESATPLLRALRQARLLVDTLEAAWQNWVLDFSPEHQRSLLERLGLENLQETGLAVLMVCTSLLVLGLTVWGVMAPRARPSPLDSVYERFCRRLAKAGLPRGPAEGPTDYAERVARSRPDLSGPVTRFVDRYIRERYSQSPTTNGVQVLERHLQEIRPRHRSAVP